MPSVATGAASAEMLADQGAQRVYVTPDKQAGIETSYLDRPLIMRELYRAGTALHPDRRLKRITRNGNRLDATFVNEYTEVEETMSCDRMMIERGTIPMDELYHEMRAGAVNDGVTDLDALVAGGQQSLYPVESKSFIEKIIKIDRILSFTEDHIFIECPHDTVQTWEYEGSLADIKGKLTSIDALV